MKALRNSGFGFAIGLIAIGISSCGQPLEPTNSQADQSQAESKPVAIAGLSEFESKMIAGWKEAHAERAADSDKTNYSVMFSLPSIAPTCRYPKYAIDVPGDPPRGKLALTFDDGPNRATTPYVLDILKKYHIHATFFLVGQRIKGNEDLLQRMVNEGHSLGNHSWDHSNFHKLNRTQVVQQLVSTENLIRPYRADRAAVMRFPYGNSNCSAEAVAEKMNYAIVGWDIDSCDWSFAEHGGTHAGSDCMDSPSAYKKYSQDYYGWLEWQLSRLHGGVVLMHDIHAFTLRHLEGAIQMWMREGYEFVALDDGSFPELIQPIHHPVLMTSARH